MYLTIGPNAKYLKDSSRKLLIDFEVNNSKQQPKSSEKKESASKLSGLAVHRKEILDALRTKLSETHGVRAHDVLSKGELESIAKKGPETLKQLEESIAISKITKYGQSILDALREDSASQMLLSPSSLKKKAREKEEGKKEEETDEDVAMLFMDDEDKGDFDDDVVDPDQDLVDFAFELDGKKNEDEGKKKRKEKKKEMISLVESDDEKGNGKKDTSFGSDKIEDEEMPLVKKKHKAKISLDDFDLDE
jgi:hypothetical protein